MKCDTCKFNSFHPAGSWMSVAEGGDDPYSYDYCSKHHWCGGEPLEPEDMVDDPWFDCKDYEEK